MNTLNVLFEKKQYHLMVLATIFVALAVSIGHAHACQLIYDTETRVTTQVGCPANYGVPPPMPSSVIGQGYGQQPVRREGVDLGNFNTNSVSTENLLSFGAAVIGALNPKNGKGNNRLSTAAEYGLITKGLTMVYDKVTEPKPQQVAQAEPQATPQQQARVTSNNWCVRKGKKYDCGNNISVITSSGGDPKCASSLNEIAPGDQVCTGIQ